MVLTCHVCQKYPSDGSRMCPFLVGNELAWEFGSLLGIIACECQIRAIVAAVIPKSARAFPYDFPKDVNLPLYCTRLNGPGDKACSNSNGMTLRDGPPC